MKIILAELESGLRFRDTSDASSNASWVSAFPSGDVGALDGLPNVLLFRLLGWGYCASLISTRRILRETHNSVFRGGKRSLKFSHGAA